MLAWWVLACWATDAIEPVELPPLVGAHSAALHPSGEWLVVGPGPEGQAWKVSLIDGRTSALPGVRPCGPHWTDVALSPDGRYLAVVCWIDWRSPEEGLWIYDLDREAVHAHRRFRTGTHVAFSADGSRVAVGFGWRGPKVFSVSGKLRSSHPRLREMHPIGSIGSDFVFHGSRSRGPIFSDHDRVARRGKASWTVQLDSFGAAVVGPEGPVWCDTQALLLTPESGEPAPLSLDTEGFACELAATAGGVVTHKTLSEDLDIDSGVPFSVGVAAERMALMFDPYAAQPRCVWSMPVGHVGPLAPCPEPDAPEAAP